LALSGRSAQRRIVDRCDAANLLFGEAALLVDYRHLCRIFWLLFATNRLLFLAVGLVCRAITALFSRARELEQMPEQRG